MLLDIENRERVFENYQSLQRIAEADINGELSLDMNGMVEFQSLKEMKAHYVIKCYFMHIR